MLLKSRKSWLEILQNDDFPWNFWSFVSYQIMNVVRTASVATFKVQFSLAAQSCLTLCDPMDCSMPGFPVHHRLLEPPQTHVHGVGAAIQPSHPLLLLPIVHQVFSSESVLCIRRPKCWNFSFNISPSSAYSELISFRIDWFDLPESKGLSRVFSNTIVQKHRFFDTQLSLWCVCVCVNV